MHEIQYKIYRLYAYIRFDVFLYVKWSGGGPVRDPPVLGQYGQPQVQHFAYLCGHISQISWPIKSIIFTGSCKDNRKIVFKCRLLIFFSKQVKIEL